MSELSEKVLEVYDHLIYTWIKKHLPPVLIGKWYEVSIHDVRLKGNILHSGVEDVINIKG